MKGFLMIGLIHLCVCQQKYLVAPVDLGWRDYSLYFSQFIKYLLTKNQST